MQALHRCATFTVHQEQEARSKEQEARRRTQAHRVTFLLLTNVRKSFWLLASVSILAVPGYNPLARHA
jgi:hypothetical protein